MSGRKLPVGEVVSEALNFSWNNFGPLLRLGLVPLMAAGVVVALDGAISSVPEGEEPDPMLQFFSFGASLISTLLWAIFAVAVHRLILKDDALPKDWFYFRFTGDEVRYAIAPLVIMILPLIIFFGLIIAAFGADILDAINSGETVTPNMSGLQLASIFIGLGLFFFIYIRLSLVLPNIVAQGKLGLVHVWKMTSGNFWRLSAMSLLLGLVALLFLFVVGVVAAIGVGIIASLGIELAEGSSGMALIATIIGGVISFFLMVFLISVAGIAMLSYAYKALSGEDDEIVVADEGM